MCGWWQCVYAAAMALHNYIQLGVSNSKHGNAKKPGGFCMLKLSSYSHMMQ